MLTPAALAQRLGRRLTLLKGGAADAPQRQKTLRDAIAWSYELLDADEQKLFRRLAVFVGGWTLDGAEAIAGASGLGQSVLDLLSSLIDHTSFSEPRMSATSRVSRCWKRSGNSPPNCSRRAASRTRCAHVMPSTLRRSPSESTRGCEAARGRRGSRECAPSTTICAPRWPGS